MIIAFPMCDLRLKNLAAWLSKKGRITSAYLFSPCTFALRLKKVSNICLIPQLWIKIIFDIYYYMKYFDILSAHHQKTKDYLVTRHRTYKLLCGVVPLVMKQHLLKFEKEKIILYIIYPHINRSAVISGGKNDYKWYRR